MANRIAVFNDGSIMQVGSPEDIYQRPNSRFVADFVGSSNVLPPDFVARHGGQRRWASLRPEAVRISVGSRMASRPPSSRAPISAARRGSASMSRASASTRCSPPASPCRPKGSPSASASRLRDLHLMDDAG